MATYLIDMVLCGIAYLIIVYFMFMLMKKRQINKRKDDDDQDGGIRLPTRPKIDLPPGIVWPSDTGQHKRTKLKKSEDREVLV
jgi:hypothetical protein